MFIKAFQAAISVPSELSKEKYDKYLYEIGLDFKDKLFTFFHSCGIKEDEYIVLEEHHNGITLIIEFQDENISNIAATCDFAHLGDVKLK